MSLQSSIIVGLCRDVHHKVDWVYTEVNTVLRAVWSEINESILMTFYIGEDCLLKHVSVYFNFDMYWYIIIDMKLTPFQWILGAFPLGVKWQGQEPEQSPPTSGKIKKTWFCTSTHLYVLMAWCLFS
jgi:hypothetical protein